LETDPASITSRRNAIERLVESDRLNDYTDGTAQSCVLVERSTRCAERDQSTPRNKCDSDLMTSGPQIAVDTARVAGRLAARNQSHWIVSRPPR
jgi:hypothetical protein